MSAEGAIGKAISARSAEDLPDEEKQGADDERAWQELLARISQQSITKHFQAYVDVPWDDPDCAIEARIRASRCPRPIRSARPPGTARSPSR